MSTDRSRITLHVVSSVDGFIANQDNTVGWMDGHPAYEGGVSERAAYEGMEPIDCYVLGSKTYEHALELGWPYGDTPTYVVTGRQLPRSRVSVYFHDGDLRRLVEEVLTPRYRNVWLVGGAQLSQSFLTQDLVDELNLVVMPVLLGGGLRLFGEGREMRWAVKSAVGFKGGYVGLRFVRA